MNCEHELEFAKRLEIIDQRSRSNTHRLDKLEESTEAINQLATSVAVMATKQDAMCESVDRLVSKIETVEGKPAKRWDGLVDKTVWAVAGAFIVYMLGQVGL